MIRLASFFALVIALVACDSQEQRVIFAPPTVPTPVTPVPPPPPFRGVITEIAGTFRSVPLTYEVTAPSDGTLVGRLTWDPRRSGAQLMLTLGDVRFPASAPDWSPVVGRREALAGQTYRVRVEEGFAVWDYHFNDPFVLKLSLE